MKKIIKILSLFFIVFSFVILGKEGFISPKNIFKETLAHNNGSVKVVGVCPSGNEKNSFNQGEIVRGRGDNFSSYTNYNWTIKKVDNPGKDIQVQSGSFNSGRDGDFCFIIWSSAYCVAGDNHSEFKWEVRKASNGHTVDSDNFFVSCSPLPSPSYIPTPSLTPTPVPTFLPTPSLEPFCFPWPSCWPSPTCWPCPTVTPTSFPTLSPTPSLSPSSTPSLTEEPTASPSLTPTPVSSSSQGEGGGEGTVGGPVGGPVGCGKPKPSAPTLLTADKKGSKATLNWTSVDSATHYSLVYGLSSSNYIYGIVNTGKTTYFEVSDLDPALDYCFAVQAVDDCAPSDLSNEICTTKKVLGVQPGQVLGLSTTSSSESSLSKTLFLSGILCFLAFLKSFLKEKRLI